MIAVRLLSVFTWAQCQHYVAQVIYFKVSVLVCCTLCYWDTGWHHILKYSLKVRKPKPMFIDVFQGGRKGGLFSPSTASLPPFSSLTPNTEDKDPTLRPSCTLGPDTAIQTDSTSITGTTHHTYNTSSCCSSCFVGNWTNRFVWLISSRTNADPHKIRPVSLSCFFFFFISLGQMLSHTGHQTALWSMSACGGCCNSREEEGYCCILSEKGHTTITWMEHTEEKDWGLCEFKPNICVFILVEIISLCDLLT